MKTVISLPVKLCLLFSILLSLFAFVRKGDEPVDKLVAVLQRWTDSVPQEKVYLHMDKPHYALGDTIWFKGYLTIGSRHQLSALSGAVYVDLITDQDSLVRSLKLPVTSGMVMGDFILGDDLQEGSYRIRAYTQWMRNAGPEYFFDHTFTVGDLLSHNIITKADYAYHDEAGKPVLTAMLNYADDTGKPLAGRDVRYTLMIGKKAVWSQNVKTDAAGNVPVKIANDKHADLAGSYIHTSITGTDKSPVTKDFPVKAGLTQSDVQFFPESGSLVNGIASKVAFKAVGIDGLGTAIKGKITDEANNEVATIETLHAGMGSFMLKPQNGKSYTAHISFADNSTKDIALPKAAGEGYVLSVYQPNKDSVLVRIHASAGKLNTTLSLIAHSNGETVFASPVKISSAITSVWLEKKAFPSGIAQFTIFDANNEPLNERIAFIKTNDKMALSIKTAKTTYGSKEHVLMDLEAMDSKGKPTFGNFSVAVTDESKVLVDEANESTIFSNLLLTSDLKGYVEKPNYYFIKNNDEETDKALDNLMLTQGYRRFEWKDLNNTTSTKSAFAVEGLGSKISGVATTLGHKPLANANVMLMALRAGVTKGTTTDANGRFKFDSLFVTDSIKFTIQARTAKNSDKVIITLDSIPKVPLSKNYNLPDVSTNISETLKAYLETGRKEDDIYEQTGQVDRVHRLREVRIKAKKIKVSDGITPQGMFRVPEGSADQVITITNPENYVSLAAALEARLPGVAVISDRGYTTLKDMRPNSGTLALILDGRKVTNPDEISEILESSVQPEDVAKIEMVRTNIAMMTYLGGPAVLILTKLGTTRRQYNPNIANIVPKGFNKVREFYSPIYGRPGNADKLPDLRTTIYWNPYLKTDASGKTSFNFFNADGPGTYRVVVEGINAAGELGREVFRYTVDGSQAATVSTASSVLAAPDDKGLSLITKPLDSVSKRLPMEKVYLQTDKPYYNIGDTLWFKSYVLDNNYQPSKISGLLYVELDDDTASMVRRISIPVKDGVGWGQIPLTKLVFREGAYTLRAYTNWMQNFGQDYIFNQRFYLGKPTGDAWLVKSSTNIKQVDGKDQLQVDLKLSHADKLLSPVAIKKVQVKLYDERHYIYSEDMQTGIDGSIKFSSAIKDTMQGRQMRVQIISLDKDDKHKMLQVPLLVNREQRIDVQFLPEGGNLIAGLKSVVGFKAIGEDGLGKSVQGAVYDSKGNKLVSFNTLHNGMGTFEFTPKAGEVYIARLNQPVDKKFRLPKIGATGTVMHIENLEKSDDLKIFLSGVASLKQDSACYLVGTSRGIAYYTSKISPEQADVTVSKSLFPSGVTRFTLFKGKTPLNQRAVFIDRHDQLSIKLTSNKTAYVKRDSVGLDIEVKDKNGIPVQGSFSLAVNDDAQVKPDSLNNYSMATSLLLNSELRGYIESPGYYVNRKDKQAWQALDNLMLTQGWTGFELIDKKDLQPGQSAKKPQLVQGVTGYEWPTVLTKPKVVKGTKQSKEIEFKPEKELVITGKVTDVANKPIKDASVLISSQKPAFLTIAKVDTNGVYEVKNLPTSDSGSFFIQANNAKGKKLSFGNITVERLITPPIPVNFKNPILPWYVNTDTTQLNYMHNVIEKADEANIKLKGRVLNEVKIKDKKIIRNSMNPFGAGNADEVYDEQDIKKSATGNIYDFLKQKIPGLRLLGAHKVDLRGMEITVPDFAFSGLRAQVNIDGGPLNIDADIPTDGAGLAATAGEVASTLPGKKIQDYSPYSSEIEDALRDIKLPGIIGVEISYSRKFTNRLGYTDADVAFIQITTDKGMGWYRRKPVGVVSYRPLPLLYPQQFYSPKYKVAANVTEPDFRSTIYWVPNITTDQNGKARVSFYTSDSKDKYTIKVAGIDNNGSIGDGTFKLNQPITIN